MAQLPLTSAQLAFSRSGRHLLVVATTQDLVTIVDTQVRADGTTNDPTRHIAIAQPISAVAFADQVWIAHASGLGRFDLQGARIGIPLALPAPSPLIAAAIGDPAAVWDATPRAALLAEGPTVRVVPIPAGDLVLPLTGRRWVTAAGSRVVVPSGLTCELPGARVLGGALALDGTVLAAVVERAGTREVVVIGLGNGRIQLRRPIPTATLIRVAARRGVLAIHVDGCAIAVIDLRSGRVLGEVPTKGPIVDFAIDPDARHVALRDEQGAVSMRDVTPAGAPPPIRVEEVAPAFAHEPAPTPAPAAPVLPAPSPPVATKRTLAIPRPLDLRALAPISPTPALERTRALALLDHELRSVALWTLHAIADAWDSRRIGYGNEGHHPYEHEVAALLRLNAGFAEEHVTAARDLLAAHEQAAPRDLRAANAPLCLLATELGLSPLATDILLVVAAPALWSEAARMYGILANDPNRAIVDEALVEQILGASVERHEIAAELDPRAPLVRLGIVAHGDRRQRPFANLVVHPVVLARLRCELPDLGVGLAVRSSERALEEIVVDPSVIERAIDALARSSTPARLAVRGRPGSGRRTLVASLAAEANRAVGVIDVAVIHGELARVLAAQLLTAQLAGLLPCIVGLDAIAFGERDTRDDIAEVLRMHPGPLAVVLPSESAAPLDADHLALELGVLGEHERLAVWQRALADAAVSVADIEAIASRYRIGPGTIQRAISSLDHASRTDATPALELFLRRQRDARLGDHARRVERLASWDQLVLPPDIVDSLRELIARVRHRKTVFETWGMEQTMATSRGLTALFSGPPGTGKTLVAGVIARELGLDLYQVDLSKMMSKWIGETERNLAAIFDAAEDGKVVLLFDEADSLFGKRTEVRSSNDRYANLEVNYLLQRLDAFEGIAILTTNATKSIDPAFKRRLSFRLSFPFPDEETREELWRAHLPPTLPRAGELAFSALAHKYQLSGGYIRNACLRAAFLAALDGSALRQDHLERAVALEFAELGKLSSSGALD